MRHHQLPMKGGAPLQSLGALIPAFPLVLLNLIYCLHPWTLGLGLRQLSQTDDCSFLLHFFISFFKVYLIILILHSFVGISLEPPDTVEN